MVSKNYAEKLLDPLWQKKRLEILQRDEFSCFWCHDTEETLHVHHKGYEKGKEPWDYHNDWLDTMCATCHFMEEFYYKNFPQEETIYHRLKIGVTENNKRQVLLIVNNDWERDYKLIEIDFKLKTIKQIFKLPVKCFTDISELELQYKFL